MAAMPAVWPGLMAREALMSDDNGMVSLDPGISRIISVTINVYAYPSIIAAHNTWCAAKFSVNAK
jgi:hypothetical protein